MHNATFHPTLVPTKQDFGSIGYAYPYPKFAKLGWPTVSGFSLVNYRKVLDGNKWLLQYQSTSPTMLTDSGGSNVGEQRTYRLYTWDYNSLTQVLEVANVANMNYGPFFDGTYYGISYQDVSGLSSPTTFAAYFATAWKVQVSSDLSSWTPHSFGFQPTYMVKDLPQRDIVTNGSTWLARSGSALQRSTNQGSSWSSISFTFPSVNYNITFGAQSANKWFYLQEPDTSSPSNTILKLSTDNGSTWSSTNYITSTHTNNMDWTSGGSMMPRISIDSNRASVALMHVKKYDAAASLPYSVIYRSTDSGVSWAAVHRGANGNQYGTAVKFITQKTWTAGNMISHNDGSTWTHQQNLFGGVLTDESVGQIYGAWSKD